MNNAWTNWGIKMQNHELIKNLNLRALNIWDELCEIHPRLCRFNCPEVKLNGRMWRCAGQAFQKEGYITLSTKFYNAGFSTRMNKIILPHEIIHMADYYLFGDSNKKCGHGDNWMMLMVQYGLDPEPFHTMNLNQKGEVI